ncbi:MULTISPECIES: glycosyltransferase [Kingella]|uniref:glycosyltransferase n=1 Tax=Kingella TaxID=32257 RepID=UPI00041329EA|nr:glycosyltransferase [Kingella kingae]
MKTKNKKQEQGNSMNINQIYISDDYDGNVNHLPPRLQKTVQSVYQNMNPSQHRVYSKEMLRDFINQEYGTEMLKVFDKLKPYAYKADLGRYLLLYRLGGWYFDISVTMLDQFPAQVDNWDFITFSEPLHMSTTSFACNNAIIYSTPNNIILEQTIYDVCANVAKEYYGYNHLFPTGPICLGRNVARFLEYTRVHLGLFTPLTPHLPYKNIAFLLNNGQIFAWYKRGGYGGDLSALGATGTNNYVHMYEQRDIYDKSITLSPELIHLTRPE